MTRWTIVSTQILNKFGSRGVIRFGTIMFGVGLMVFSQVETIPMFYGTMVLMMFGCSMAGYFPLNVGVIQWFERKRARALSMISLGLGIVNAFDNPARRGFVTELVEPDEISNAISLNTAVMTGSRIVGPALAAALKGPLGVGWLFIANGVSFLAILWPLLSLNLDELYPVPPARRGGTPVRDALRFVRNDRRLLAVFVVFTLVGTFAFNYNVSLLKLADVRFGKDWLFGILLASTGLGSMMRRSLPEAPGPLGHPTAPRVEPSVMAPQAASLKAASRSHARASAPHLSSRTPCADSSIFSMTPPRGWRHWP